MAHSIAAPGQCVSEQEMCHAKLAGCRHVHVPAIGGRDRRSPNQADPGTRRIGQSGTAALRVQRLAVPPLSAEATRICAARSFAMRSCDSNVGSVLFANEAMF